MTFSHSRTYTLLLACCTSHQAINPISIFSLGPDKVFAWTPHPIVKVAQSCLTLCNPMDYTVHGILQARILKWVAITFPRGSSQPRDWTQVSCIAGRFFTSWAKERLWKTRVWGVVVLESSAPHLMFGTRLPIRRPIRCKTATWLRVHVQTTASQLPMMLAKLLHLLCLGFLNCMRAY